MRFVITVILVLVVSFVCATPGTLLKATRNSRRAPGDTLVPSLTSSSSSRWSLPFTSRIEPEKPRKRQVPTFDDESRIVFPTQRPRTTATSTPPPPLRHRTRSTTKTTFAPIDFLPKRTELGGGQGNQVPVSLFLELKNVTNPVDFLYRYVIEGKADSGSNFLKRDRNNSYGSSFLRERTLSAPFAHAAGCTPQPTTVPIEMNAEPYVMYFPSCTRVDRCDGCCNTDLLECTPTKTEMSRLQVLKVKYLGPDVNKFDISEPVIVELEKHLQCDCQCRVKASDCRFYQVYRPNECRCECTNQEDATGCKGDRFWDLNTCKCRCREHLDCSTGFFFNPETCSCEVMRTSRFGNLPAFRGF